MARSLVRISVILVLAAGAGYIRARDLPWTVDRNAIQREEDRRAEIRATAGVTLEELQAMIEQGAVVIDARPAEAFEEEHLETGFDPPVLNVPADDLDLNIDRLIPLKGYPTVLYCTSITCDYAEDLYMEMEAYGFYGIKIYFPGWEAIKEAGLPTASGPDVWTGFDGASGGSPDPNAADPNSSDNNEP